VTWRLAGGLVLALASACALNWSYFVQLGAAASLPPLSLRRPWRSLTALFGNRRWLVGFWTGIGGWVLYVVALTLAPLSLVQACAAGGLAVLAALAGVRSRREQLAVVTSIAAGPLSNSVPKRPLVVTTSKGTFRSGDSGSTWTAATGVPENLTLTTAVYSPLDPNLVYAGADQGGSNGGDLLRSTDGGASFSVADAGLPNQVREVESLAVEQTTPPTVIAALDPASGGLVFSETDATAPVPPALLPEASGQSIPATLATTAPTPKPSLAAPLATPTPPANGGGVGKFLGSVFHWPVPLVFEVLLVLAIAYLLLRWRQRSYVEGPP